jgi:hypothetical protein
LPWLAIKKVLFQKKHDFLSKKSGFLNKGLNYKTTFVEKGKK